MSKDTEKHWNDRAREVLVGRRIVSAQYMTEKEARNHGWLKRPVMFTLDDGTVMYASSDDEGNDGGALFGSTKDGTDATLPVL